MRLFFWPQGQRESHKPLWGLVWLPSGYYGDEESLFVSFSFPRMICQAQGARADRIPSPGQGGEHSSGAEHGWDLPFTQINPKQSTSSDGHILLACHISYGHVHRVFFFSMKWWFLEGKKKGDGDNTYLYRDRFMFPWVYCTFCLSVPLSMLLARESFPSAAGAGLWQGELWKERGAEIL